MALFSFEPLFPKENPFKTHKVLKERDLYPCFLCFLLTIYQIFCYSELLWGMEDP